MHKNPLIIKSSILLFAAFICLFLTCSGSYARDFTWYDISKPYYPDIKITNREKIVLDIPASIVNGAAYLDLEVSTYDLDPTEVGYLKIGDSLFSNYYSLSGDDQKRVTKTIRISTKDLSPGSNTFYIGNRDMQGGYYFYLKMLKFINLPVSRHTLSIASTPSGSDVYIDGKYRGQTPLSTNLKEGRYSVRVKRNGYTEVRRNYDINADRRLSFELDRKAYEVMITSSPPGAKVTIDNSYRGETPLSGVQLEEGNHHIVVGKKGYESVTRAVDAFADDTVDFTLTPQRFVLEITSSPTRADVSIDGTRKGTTPLSVKVNKGKHTVTIAKKGYESVTRATRIDAADKSLSIALSEVIHSIDINADVAGVSIYIDDRLQGSTPLHDIRISRGSHKITFQKDGYRTIAENITITSGTSEIYRSMDEFIKAAATASVLPADREKTALSETPSSDTLKRTALVIGNSNYRAAPLKNPGHDAQDITKALKKHDFEVITRVDVDKRDMIKAIYEFGNKLRRSDIGLFFYAGHGLQINGTNYLVPLATDVQSAVDVEFEAVNVGRILGKMKEAGNLLNIVILDACRNNPFRSFFRGQEQGLAKMDAPIGTIIAYATAPGSVARDGAGRNGIFTKHLLAVLHEDGLTVRDLFDRAGMGVIRETGRQQVPWIHSSPMEPVYITGGERH